MQSPITSDIEKPFENWSATTDFFHLFRSPFNLSLLDSDLVEGIEAMARNFPASYSPAFPVLSEFESLIFVLHNQENASKALLALPSDYTAYCRAIFLLNDVADTSALIFDKIHLLNYTSPKFTKSTLFVALGDQFPFVPQLTSFSTPLELVASMSPGAFYKIHHNFSAYASSGLSPLVASKPTLDLFQVFGFLGIFNFILPLSLRRMDYAAQWPFVYLFAFLVRAFFIALFPVALAAATYIYHTELVIFFWKYVHAFFDFYPCWSPTTRTFSIYCHRSWWFGFDYEATVHYFKTLSVSDIIPEIRRIAWINYCSLKLTFIYLHNVYMHLSGYDSSHFWAFPASRNPEFLQKWTW
jgi:hypothetical protein